MANKRIAVAFRASLDVAQRLHAATVRPQRRSPVARRRLREQSAR